MLVDHGHVEYAMSVSDDGYLIQNICRRGCLQRDHHLSTGIRAMDLCVGQTGDGGTHLVYTRWHRVHDQSNDVQFMHG